MGALPEQMTKMVSRINEKNPYLLAGLLAGVSVSRIIFVLQNKINEINTVQTEISGLQQSGTSTKSDIDRLTQYETELKSLNEKGEKLKVMIKTKEEARSFWKMFQRWPTATALRLNRSCRIRIKEKSF